MTDRQMLARYAEVAIKVGLDIRRGDRLVIDSPTGTIDFVRLLVEEAYRNGAVNVDVLREDDAVVRASPGVPEAAEAKRGDSSLRTPPP